MSDLVVKYAFSIDTLLEKERNGILNDSDNIFELGIEKEHRSILVDWLIEVYICFELSPATFTIAINIIDAVLGRTNITTETLQLLGVASLFLSAKYNEVETQDVDDYVCHNVYTKEQILDTSKKIFILIGCNMNISHEMEYSRNQGNLEANICFSIFVEGSIFLPSVISTSVNKILSKIEKSIYINHMKIPENVVDICMCNIIDSCKRLKRSNLKAFTKLGSNVEDIEKWNEIFDKLCDIDTSKIEIL